MKAYVYRCEHKITKRFYIGYREANTLPARSDFGSVYFTSCPEVSNNFQEYSYKILGEFNNPRTAFEVEQKLIHEARNNNLLINKNWKKSNLILGTDVNLKSLTHHIPKYDLATGTTRLVKKRRKSLKLHIPTEHERLGMTDKEYMERRKQRRERKLLKKA